MKRIKLDIRSSKYPDDLYIGQALINELGLERLYFYTTHKFPIDGELDIDCNSNGTQLHYKVVMSHLHEQISSGRVMTGLPVEGEPFPARKFYRCFGTVISRQVLNAPEVTPIVAAEDVSPVEGATVTPIVAEAKPAAVAGMNVPPEVAAEILTPTAEPKAA